MESSGEYILGCIFLLSGIGQVLSGMRAIRSGKVIDTRSFVFHKGKGAAIYGKWGIRFGVFFMVIGTLAIVLGIYSEFH